MYYGARYYDPWVGRFMSQDPELTGASAGATFAGIQSDPQQSNAYTYALNAPTRYVDPSGRTPIRYLQVTQTVGAGEMGGLREETTNIRLGWSGKGEQGGGGGSGGTPAGDAALGTSTSNQGGAFHTTMVDGTAITTYIPRGNQESADAAMEGEQIGTVVGSAVVAAGVAATAYGPAAAQTAKTAGQRGLQQGATRARELGTLTRQGTAEAVKNPAGFGTAFNVGMGEGYNFGAPGGPPVLQTIPNAPPSVNLGLITGRATGKMIRFLSTGGL